MRVTFMDPQGPRLWRLAPYALPFLMLPLAFSGVFGATGGVALAAFAAGIFNFLGLIPARQRHPRTAELETGPGFVRIRNAGGRDQQIRAKDITGATTARTKSGILLTLQHRKRAQPLTLELSSEAEVERVRHALGIGHGGFGTIAWRTLNDSTTSAALVGRVLGFTVAMLAMVVASTGSAEAARIAASTLGQSGVIGTILGLMGLYATGPQPSIFMGSDGLRLKTPRGWFALPYDAIHHVEAGPRGLVFHVPEPYFRVAVERVSPWLGGPSDHEHEVIALQVQAASQRARGLGPHKRDVTGRVDVLRRQGESPRDWLVRLDMAGQLLSTGSGYRGNTLDAEDLWTILEDPEAEPDLRAAAARVLRHQPTPEARVRIDAAVAAVRDVSANRRLRIAIQDDVDGASQELAMLDATEPRRHAMPVPMPHDFPGRRPGGPDGPMYGR